MSSDRFSLVSCHSSACCVGGLEAALTSQAEGTTGQSSRTAGGTKDGSNETLHCLITVRFNQPGASHVKQAVPMAATRASTSLIYS